MVIDTSSGSGKEGMGCSVADSISMKEALKQGPFILLDKVR